MAFLALQPLRVVPLHTLRWVWRCGLQAKSLLHIVLSMGDPEINAGAVSFAYGEAAAALWHPAPFVSAVALLLRSSLLTSPDGHAGH